MQECGRRLKKNTPLLVSFKKSKHTGKQKLHKANLSSANNCVTQDREASTGPEASRPSGLHPGVNLTRL